ncbi:MAG: diphthamide biosynthesis enzyme Dph2 [Thermoplasmata archaeon]|nr:diphthamide biosynthesis enzyme Dph2 [Thermoplasmata archaeon]
MMEKFDFEIARIIRTINGRGCRKILLQFPEGLKRKAAQVAVAISGQVKSEIIIHGEPCFGACDVPRTSADLIIHFGHLPIPCLDSPNSIMFIQAKSDVDPMPVLEMAVDKLPRKIGLLTTAQHIHMIVPAMNFLEEKGKEVLVGKGDGRLFAEGQVLGCNASVARNVAKKVDAFLFVGTGNFHPLAVALASSKPVIIADPVNNEVRDISEVRDRMLRQRHATIEKAREAKHFGILLSEKPGQRREKMADYVKKILADKQQHLDAVIVEMDLVTPQKLDAFGLDAWVSTACPRLAIDDYAAFSVPVLTPIELEILLGKRAWNDYVFDEILEGQ